jgi:hypothetical protein
MGSDGQERDIGSGNQGGAVIDIIRIPADVARSALYHPEFRFLSVMLPVHGDWVERVSDKVMFFEVRNIHEDDAKAFKAFCQKVAGSKLNNQASGMKPSSL